MKPIVIALLAAAACAWAQSESAEVEKALMGAPDNMKKDATVVKWKSDFTYETLKKGTNRMVCYDLSGEPGQRTPFAIECTSIANLDRVAQNLKFNAISDKAQRDEAFAKAEKDGSRVKPEFGSVWIHLMGPDAEHTRKHVTIAVPEATAQSLGMPDNPRQGGMWIMNAGTTTAHLMIPGN
ncbi:MAG TPA: hypothetical protein VH640_12405 [Bryobacteraceae bacterium]